MPCCLVFLLALLFPRLILVLAWIFNPAFISNAYSMWILPLLGLIFLPMTTLAYAWACTFQSGPASIAGIIVIGLAVLYDLGSAGAGSASKQRSPSQR